MVKYFIFALAAILILAGGRGMANNITITVTAQQHDYNSPWQKRDITKHTLSGCVIEGDLVLTAAYSLTDAVLLEVSKPGGTKKYRADVVVKDYHCGLALLRVSDREFFRGIAPSRIRTASGIAGKKGVIRKWDSLGAAREYTTETIISSMRTYKPNYAVLMHQLSTNMSEGGDGDPVFIDGELAGITTGFDNETKTVYVISSETVLRMLGDLKDGRYDGMPFFWVDYLEINSDVNLREMLGLTERETGVYVNRICGKSSGFRILKEGDVIIEINGRTIDDDGMFTSDHYGRLNFYGLLYLNTSVGDTVSMTVVREKKQLKLKFNLRPVDDESFLIPELCYDSRPAFAIIGGLVFQELTRGYLETWGNNWSKSADNRMLYIYMTRNMDTSTDKTRMVILNRVLPAACNYGYHGKNNLILEDINGHVINNIQEIEKIISQLKDPFIRFNFVGGESIVLGREEAIKATDNIRKTYNIPD